MKSKDTYVAIRGELYFPENDITETLADGRTILVASKGVGIPLAEATVKGLVKDGAVVAPSEFKAAKDAEREAAEEAAREAAVEAQVAAAAQKNAPKDKPVNGIGSTVQAQRKTP